MSLILSDASTEHPVTPHMQALKERHALLSRKIEEAHKNLSASDSYIKRLKKEKLKVKEMLVATA